VEKRIKANPGELKLIRFPLEIISLPVVLDLGLLFYTAYTALKGGEVDKHNKQ
jgi:hypothetical protein